MPRHQHVCMEPFSEHLKTRWIGLDARTKQKESKLIGELTWVGAGALQKLPSDQIINPLSKMPPGRLVERLVEHPCRPGPASCRQDPWGGEVSPDPSRRLLSSSLAGDVIVQGNVVSRRAGRARSPRWSKVVGRRLVRRDRAREAGSCWATWAPGAQPG